MPRPPYDAHLCAHDPEAFEGGFKFARYWVDHLAYPGQPEAIYLLIRDSSGIKFAATAAAVELPATAETEGFMLGVYGYVRLMSDSGGCRSSATR